MLNRIRYTYWPFSIKIGRNVCEERETVGRGKGGRKVGAKRTEGTSVLLSRRLWKTSREHRSSRPCQSSIVFISLSSLPLALIDDVDMSNNDRAWAALPEGNRPHLRIWTQKTITEEVCQDLDAVTMKSMESPLVWSACISNLTTPGEESTTECWCFQSIGKTVNRPKL